MKLHYSAASPYARKVLMAAFELGLGERIELVRTTATPTATSSDLDRLNPLAKIPVLELEDGTGLYDSRVIVEYLDALAGGKLIPAAGAARWVELRRQAAADGANDAALLARYEAALRPEALRWPEWSAGQLRKIEQALGVLGDEFAQPEAFFGIGRIAAFSALQYLDFRFADFGWRDRHPGLAAFYEKTALRPSAKALPVQAI